MDSMEKDRDRRRHAEDTPDIMEEPTADTGEPSVEDSPMIHPDGEPITPQRPGSMPRAEDDEAVRQESPEFHDRPDPTRRDRRG